MVRDEFEQLFISVLNEAAEEAEHRLGRNIPRNFQIELYGPGHPAGDILDVEAALTVLYLGEELFYRIIDVAITEVRSSSTKAFVRVSGHKPSAFGDTWNTPPGHGPFKILLAPIKVVSE